MDESWPRNRFGSAEQSADGTRSKGEVRHIDAEMIRSVIHHRRLRRSYFGDDLFADPAWDMMLQLLLAELMQVRVAVSDLCDGAGIPPTTALRWHKFLVGRKLLVRRPDPHDARRVFVELSCEASQALRRYFAEFDGRGAAAS